MKRRDLLKSAGTMMLAAPTVRASALGNLSLKARAQGQPSNLVVTFSGPFCFWQDGGQIKVMFPPIGAGDDPHRPWVGTTANTQLLTGHTDFSLIVPGFSGQASKALALSGGTDLFTYSQGEPMGEPPLLNVFLPMPTHFVGIHPTSVQMICTPSTPDNYCKEYMVFASGVSLIYENLDIDGVVLNTMDSKEPAPYYKPCFTNDLYVSEATMTFHLTALNRVTDPNHTHAKRVWRKMLSMYPWMLTEITGIEFCHDFDYSACPASCRTSSTPKPDARPQDSLVGPSNDCEVPIMFLRQGSNAKRKR
jgi:hypothetical protein